MQADYRRIHELEYELGFRDDPPLLQRLEITDAPGTVIYYDLGRDGRPMWTEGVYPPRLDWR